MSSKFLNINVQMYIGANKMLHQCFNTKKKPNSVNKFELDTIKQLFIYNLQNVVI